MSDLAARLTERLRRRDEKIAALEACIEELEQGLQVTCEREAATTARYDTRIEALEAQVRAADALAEQVQRVKDFRYDPNIGIELNRLEEALTAYRATKEGGE